MNIEERLQTATKVDDNFYFDFSEDNHDYFVKDYNDKWKLGIGVTTVIGATMPKHLSWWASGMALQSFGWQNKKHADDTSRIEVAKKYREDISKLTDKEYEKLLQDSYRSHNTYMNKRAKEGTNTHEKVELWIKECIKSRDIIKPKDDEILPIFDWAVKNKVEFVDAERPLYERKTGVCGTCDIVYKIGDKIYLADIKTGKSIFFSYKVQLGKYSEMVKEDIEGFSILRINNNKLEVDSMNKEEAEEMATFFNYCLAQYRILQKYI